MQILSWRYAKCDTVSSASITTKAGYELVKVPLGYVSYPFIKEKQGKQLFWKILNKKLKKNL